MENLARHSAVRYGGALAAVLLASLLRLLLDRELGDHYPLTFFLCAVAFATWFGGFGPALLALATGFLFGDWLFVEPRFTFLLSACTAGLAA